MSGSDDDWFNKDEDDLVQGLQKQVKLLENDKHEERIELATKAEHFAKQFCVELKPSDSANGTTSKTRFSTGELAKALQMTPLEMFLYFMTERRDILKNQVSATESQKRISHYVETLKVLCQMELGGYDEQLVSGFAHQVVLLKHIKCFAEQLFGKTKAKGKLDGDSELLLRNIKWLLLRAHKLGVLDESGYELIEHFKTLLSRCRMPQLLQHQLCIEFSQELAVLPIVSNVKNEIYPKLDELLQPASVELAKTATTAVPDDAAGYINWHRRLLCDNFCQPLREFVQRLQDKSYVKTLVAQHVVWEQTELKLNPDFQEAEQHSLIFMDIRPAERKENAKLSKSFLWFQHEFLKNIKTNELLCFTTSYDFDNLILAMVGYTEPEMLKQGYLSVEIVKQYNIGNIYGKSLIMFKTPVFFEPYLRVHNYLSICSADNFPMRRYIVDGCLVTKEPTYMDFGVRLECTRNCPSQLNEFQQRAFREAMYNDFCLIQGPPGTGKTHLSVELLSALLKTVAVEQTGPIVVLTYTNDSLDKFLLKASKHTDSIVRLGSQTRVKELKKYTLRSMTDESSVPPRLKRIWWQVKCEYKEKFEQLQAMHANFDGTDEDYHRIQKAQEDLQQVTEKRNTLRTIFQFFVVRDKALLAMTTTCGARLNYLLRLLQSKCYIFEEAAETPESHVLACLTPYAEHVIQIGDHKQLQPYTSDYTQQGLQVSLFERLINNGFPVSVLGTQYRMRPSIAELLVPTFYEELINDATVCRFKNVAGMAANLYFLNHNSPEEQLNDMSFINKLEAERLVELAIKLKCDKSDLVILSPYNAQVEYIKELFFKKAKKCSVATVDSYQGLEANIVLLSLVRSNPAGKIGFLRLPNRVCVALSRARWGLYITGNMETLQRGNQELWGAINAKLQAQNAIGNEFPVIADQLK